MTGWRIGYAAGPREVIGAATRVQRQNSGNANSMRQWGGVEALTGPQDEVGKMREQFRERRELVVARTRKLPGFKLPNVPQGAFYVFPNVTGLFGSSYNGKTVADGDGLAELMLTEAHVASVGGNDFGAPGHAPFSYATSIPKINEPFDRIARLLPKFTPPR